MVYKGYQIWPEPGKRINLNSFLALPFFKGELEGILVLKIPLHPL
jgi:hypothetical protein